MDINRTTRGKRNKLWSNKAGCSTTGDIIILEFEIWKNGGDAALSTTVMSLHLQRHECTGKTAIKAERKKQQEEEFVPTGTSKPSDFILP